MVHTAARGTFTAAATFAAIGTHHRIVVTRPEVLGPAIVVAREHLADLDAAVSRFRSDSEVTALACRARRGTATQLVSPVFVDVLTAGLRAARLTDGLVDPTLGAALVAAGYDADLAVVQVADRRPSRAPVTRVDWRDVRLEPGLGRVTVPRGALLDLGATAKARAADVIAGRLADTLPGGFLVSLGGDVAVSGELPPRGWQIGVEGTGGEERQVVTSRGQAFATSSTRRRTWTQGGRSRHHIIDPRTGETASTHWEQVTCAGIDAVEANAASTAAVVLGPEAPAWLEARGIPARLDRARDAAVVTTTGWPRPTPAAAPRAVA